MKVCTFLSPYHQAFSAFVFSIRNKAFQLQVSEINAINTNLLKQCKMI
jgi:hypothetical protein